MSKTRTTGTPIEVYDIHEPEAMVPCPVEPSYCGWLTDTVRPASTWSNDCMSAAGMCACSLILGTLNSIIYAVTTDNVIIAR